MLVTPIVHLNPETYKDPLKFNPWRWKVCHFIIKNSQDKNKKREFMSFQEFWTSPDLLFCFLYYYTYRILTKLLFPSLSCHLAEVRDNVLGQSSVKFTWRPFSMSWSPNTGIYLFIFEKKQAYHGENLIKMIMLLFTVTDGQRWKEDVSLEVRFYYFPMVFILKFHQSVIESA